MQVGATRTNQVAYLFFQVSAEAPARQDGGEPDQVGPGRGQLEGSGTGVQIKVQDDIGTARSHAQVRRRSSRAGSAGHAWCSMAPTVRYLGQPGHLATD